MLVRLAQERLSSQEMQLVEMRTVRLGESYSCEAIGGVHHRVLLIIDCALFVCCVWFCACEPQGVSADGTVEYYRQKAPNEVRA